MRSSDKLGHTWKMSSMLPRAAGLAVVAAVLAAVPLHSRDSPQTIVTFEATRTGTLPPAFRTLTSVADEPGRWQTTTLDRRAVLAQTDLDRSGYRLAVRDDVSLKDVQVGARVRVGRGDRAAGIAWRVQDAQNYYAARLDFDDHEVVLYKFVRGNRVRLDRRSGLRLDPDAWHELVVEHLGARMRVWLNGIPVAGDSDEALVQAGGVGFWVPGDGTAHFERLWYRALDESR